MALALYRKYRPRTFAEVIGQEHVTEPLSQALRSGRLHHAYLFSGPRGCGKTSSARILARSLNCEQGPTPDPCGVCASCKSLANDGAGSIDVIEIDAASHGGVDDARELREKAFFAPASSRYKIYVIDEAHMVSSAGFNALLKLVEEPPDYVKFIFATTEPEKVLGTIRSRTHHYPFRLIPPAVLRPYLQQLTEAEGIHVDPAVFPLVVRAGGGSARDTLSVLDQLIAGAGPEGVGYARAVTLLGVTDVALIDEMCDAIAAGDGAAAYQTIDRVAEAGHDARRFASDLLERFRDLIILQQVPDAVTKGLIDGPADQLDAMTAQATRLGPATLSRCADIVHNGLVEMRGTTAPRLLLELITARMLLPGADDTTGALLQRLERMERRLTLSADHPEAVRPSPAPEESPSDGGGNGGGGLSAARAAAAAAARRAPAGPGAARSAPGDAGEPPVQTPPGGGRTPDAVAAGGQVGSPADGLSGIGPGGLGVGVDRPGVSDEVSAPADDRGGSPADGGSPVSASVVAGSAAAGGSDAVGSPGAAPGPEVGSGAPDWEALAEPPDTAPDDDVPAPAADHRAEPSAPPVREPEPAGVLPDAPEEFDEPAAPGQLTAAAVREVWPEIIAVVGRQSKKVAALASGATVRDLDGQTVVLTFRFPAHAKMVADQPQFIVDALYEALGGRWQIRCEVAGEAGGVRAGGAPGRGAPPQAGPAHRPNPPQPGAPQANGPAAQRPQASSGAMSSGRTPGPQRQAAAEPTHSDDGDDWPEPARPGGMAPAARPGAQADGTPSGQTSGSPSGLPGGDPAGQAGGSPSGLPGGGLGGQAGVGPSGLPGGGPSGLAGGGPSGLAGGSPSGAAGGSPGGQAIGGPSGSAGGGLGGQAIGGASGPAGGSPSGPAGGSPSGVGDGRGGIDSAGNAWSGPAGGTSPDTAGTGAAHAPGGAADGGPGNGGAAPTSPQAGVPARTEPPASRNPAPQPAGPTSATAPGGNAAPNAGRAGAPAPSSGLAAARAAAAAGSARAGQGARPGSTAASARNAPGAPAGRSTPAARNAPAAWSDGSPTEEAPYDPEFDGAAAPEGTPAYEGFDPGDEPLDDVIDEKTARQSSEQQAMELLREAFGAEKISEL